LYDGKIVEYGDEEHFKNSKVKVVQQFLNSDSTGIF